MRNHNILNEQINSKANKIPTHPVEINIFRTLGFPKGSGDLGQEGINNQSEGED